LAPAYLEDYSVAVKSTPGKASKAHDNLCLSTERHLSTLKVREISEYLKIGPGEERDKSPGRDVRRGSEVVARGAAQFEDLIPSLCPLCVDFLFRFNNCSDTEITLLFQEIN
jgi:hypothetical protein